MAPFPTNDSTDFEDFDLWVCASMNKNQQSMNEIINGLKPQHVANVAGAGNKIVYLLD
jgi:hypothetical protein